jgi:cytidylate kinase
MHRALAPLVRPAGALVVDSTALAPAAVVEIMLKAVEQIWCCTQR